jgi:hypothetical protein
MRDRNIPSEIMPTHNSVQAFIFFASALMVPD